MEAARRRALIEQYSEDEFDARPADGWTPREVAHHLADSETMSYIRLRRLLAETHPVIQGYDEPEYARRLHYDRPIASSLELFRAVRVVPPPSYQEKAREPLPSGPRVLRSCRVRLCSRSNSRARQLAYVGTWR